MIRLGLRQCVNHFLRYLPAGLANHYLKPTLVEWKITYNCNLSCSHCDYWKLGDYQELNTNQAFALLDNLHQWLGPFNLSIYGGEPLLRQDLSDIIRRALSLNIYPTLTTNGTIACLSFLKKIKQRKKIFLNFSLDGLSSDALLHRGHTASAKPIIENIAAAQRYTHIKIFATLMHHTLKDVPGLLEFSRKNKIPISFQALVPSLGAAWDLSRHTNEIYWPDILSARQTIEHIIACKKKGYPVYNSFAHLACMISYYQNPNIYSQPHNCKARFENLTVMPDGSLKICMYTEDIGNACEEDLKKIWQSHKTKNTRTQMASCRQGCFILRCYFRDSLWTKIKNAQIRKTVFKIR